MGKSLQYRWTTSSQKKKFYIARFKTSELDNVHVSRPNLHFPKVVLGRAGFRTKAVEKKGVGWQLEDLKANFILNLLYKIEFAHLNSPN